MEDGVSNPEQILMLLNITANGSQFSSWWSSYIQRYQTGTCGLFVERVRVKKRQRDVRVCFYRSFIQACMIKRETSVLSKSANKLVGCTSIVYNSFSRVCLSFLSTSILF